MNSAGHALLELGRALRARGYTFTTITPASHARIEARARRTGSQRARDLRDVFGWSRPFEPALLPSRWLELLRAAGALGRAGELAYSRVRFSSLGDELMVHTSFPTHDADSVFFGPDTYRFCALLRRWVTRAERVVDVGCGTGAGGLVLADRAARITLADINPRALLLAEVNAALAGVSVELVHGDLLESIAGDVDLIVANPPYMRDPEARVYRDGGGKHGEALSVRIVTESSCRLRAGGQLVLYTGSAVVDGVDTFRAAIAPHLAASAAQFTYEELDPDVFGEELEQPAYTGVERIAAVALRVVQPA